MEIDCNTNENLEYIFDHLDIDEDGKITLHEFVQGVLQLRGHARAKRVFEMHCDLIRESNLINKQMSSMRRMQKAQGLAMDEMYKKLSDMEVGKNQDKVKVTVKREKSEAKSESPHHVRGAASESLTVGSAVKLVGMSEASQLNGRTGTIVNTAHTASSQFAVNLGEGYPVFLVERKNLQTLEKIPEAKNFAPTTHQVEQVKEVSKESNEVQMVPAGSSGQYIVQPVLLTAVARQSAALRDVDAKVQVLTDTVMSIARNTQRSPRSQAATQIIYSQPPPSQGPSVGDAALHSLEHRMTVRTTALEQEMRALRETILQCIPLSTTMAGQRQFQATSLGNSQVLS